MQILLRFLLPNNKKYKNVSLNWTTKIKKYKFIK